MRSQGPAWNRAVVFGAMLWTLAAAATDVAFWEEYCPTGTEAEETWLLLGFGQQPLRADAGAFTALDVVGPAEVVGGGRFGPGLRLNGTGALRCLPADIFPGGALSIEAWVKLERLPEREACIVFRPAVVDASPQYDRTKDRTKGFALLVDSQGALHLETTNCFYGRRVRTSTAPGVVPVGRWVHLAGTSVVFPVSMRRLFLDGRLLVETPIAWGEGITVHGDEEVETQPVFIGNNADGTAGLSGCLDQVRIHRHVQMFWPLEDSAWTDPAATRPVPDGPPHFVARHRPVAIVPLDESADCATVPGAPPVKVSLGKGQFVPGVRGQAYAGPVRLAAPAIFRAAGGAIEFWMRPRGVNSRSDRNRAFVGEPFVFYIFNGGDWSQPVTLYWRGPTGLVFVHSETDLHPARWFHVIISWKGKAAEVYLDGTRTGRHFGEPLRPNQRDTADAFQLSGDPPNCAVDEVRIYDRALLPEEAANAWRRYRDPAAMVADVRLPAIEIAGEVMPSSRTIHYQLTPAEGVSDLAGIRLDLRDGQGQVLATRKLPGDTRQGAFEYAADLADGWYDLATTALAADGTGTPGTPLRFLRRRFAWEGNDLGRGEEVYPPFTPVATAGNTVRVVGRQMIMNHFGLWDQVTSLGRDLLAAPVALVGETADGTRLRWQNGDGRWTGTTPLAATYSATVASEPLRIATRSTVEVDGCMRVEMTLEPGPAPCELRNLRLEVPLRDAEVPLMHTIADGLRHNYAGTTPAGQGRVWDGSKAERSEPWRNAFVPYVWLGAAARGLALFAENDNGWVTAKGKDAPPTHELVRGDGRLTLLVHLVNRPFTPSARLQLVLGLQASPTKPLPDDWRKQHPIMQGGLAVVPWGGLQCASQGPFADDWTIVDKVLDTRYGKPFDKPWFEDYYQRHHPPNVHGNADWRTMQAHFASVCGDRGVKGLTSVYQEEMRAAHSRPEWVVYQDEWKTANGPQPRELGETFDLGGGHRDLSGISCITFPRSYADFGVWIADQWLSRGITLYWDNTYLYPSYNTRTSAAYVAEDGLIQPALTIWNVREYHRRVWRRLQHWRRQRSEPIEWTLHMTNTVVLPVHTWGTTDLDHELGSKRPFTPDWLLTETVGRQVGNYALSLYEVLGRDNEVAKALPPEQRDAAEWGLRAVHEIQRGGAREKLLQDFGYADPAVRIHNYWADAPVLRVEPDSVKWLALEKPATHEWLLVLAAWSESPVEAALSFTPAAAVADPAALRLRDALTDAPVAESAAGPVKLPVPGPWGNRVVRVLPR